MMLMQCTAVSALFNMIHVTHVWNRWPAHHYDSYVLSQMQGGNNIYIVLLYYKSSVWEMKLEKLYCYKKIIFDPGGVWCNTAWKWIIFQ